VKSSTGLSGVQVLEFSRYVDVISHVGERMWLGTFDMSKEATRVGR
jgi:hypothetical protein